MRVCWQRLSLAAAIAIGAVLLLGLPVDAQCSMCRTALTGANSAFVRNFNIGVLVLLVPPVTIFCSIFLILKRHRSPRE